MEVNDYADWRHCATLHSYGLYALNRWLLINPVYGNANASSVASCVMAVRDDRNTITVCTKTRQESLIDRREKTIDYR